MKCARHRDECVLFTRAFVEYKFEDLQSSKEIYRTWDDDDDDYYYEMAEESIET